MWIVSFVLYAFLVFSSLFLPSPSSFPPPLAPPPPHPFYRLLEFNNYHFESYGDNSKIMRSSIISEVSSLLCYNRIGI